MVRLLPRFREDRILREQVAVCGRNLRVGVPASWFTALLGTWGRDGPLSDSALLPWFAVYTVLMLLGLVVDAAIRRQLLAPRPAAITLVIFFGAMGFGWGCLPLHALYEPDLTRMMVAIGLVAGISAGVMTMNASVLPVYLAYVSMAVPLLGAACFLYGGQLIALGWGAVVYVVATVAIAAHSERAIRDTIELRFENLDLVVQLKAAMALAEAARDEALAANAAKSRFLAAASHDLRQPTHALGLLLDVLGRSALDAHQARVHHNLVAAADATRQMLNTLLDFSRIEAGVLQPEARAFRIQELLTRIDSEFALEADAKGLLYRSRESQLCVRSDPGLVELVLRNLVSNAIRYTQRGGVLVGVRRRGRMAVVEVWDTGIGIACDKHAEIFQEFRQLGNPERDRQKGLGLGLAICEGIARTLGHPLGLVSTLGRGSVFRLGLPMAEGSEPAAVQDGIEDRLLAAPQGSLDARLLVIDDNDTAREALQTLLESWGAHCVAVESIDKAVDVAAAFEPDLLISDYRLREERTGGEAVEAIRAALGRRVPAIIVTGDTAPERLRDAAAVDAVLMHKPVSLMQLREAMTSLLAQREPDAATASQASVPA